MDRSRVENLASDYINPFQTILKYLKITGIDLLDEGVMFLKTKHLCLLMFSLHVLITIGSCSFLVTAAANGVDLLEVVIDLSFAYETVEGLVFYTQVLYNKKKMKSFVLNLGEEWRDDENLSPDLVALNQKKIKSLDRFHNAFFVCLSIFVQIYMFAPVTMVTVKKFIFKQEVPYILPYRVSLFNYDDNFILYLIIYGLVYVMTMSLAYVINGILFLLTVCMTQLRIQFESLQNELRDIFSSKEDLNIDEKIKRAVRKHSRLLNLIQELSSAFGVIFALHIFIISGVICFFCVTAMITGRLKDQINVMGSLISIATIYHCCYNGQLLSDACANVGVATYDSEWYSLSCERKKIVLIIILRSQRIEYIKSTSLTFVSLTIFVKVLNMAWSFISLISGMYEEE